MRLAVVSAWNDAMKELAALVMPNHEEYCRHWGYDSITRDQWHGSALWSVWDLAASVLVRYDWVFRLDIDTLFMDMTKPLGGFLDGTDFLATVDVNGLNTGAVFLRNSPWAAGFLAKIIAAGPRFAAHPSTDQSTVAYLLYAEPRDKWGVVPQKLFNAFLYGEYPGLSFPEGQYEGGDFLLHLPALPNSRRLVIFRDYLQRVKR